MDDLMKAAVIAFAEMGAGDRIRVAATRVSAAAWCAALAAAFATASTGCAVAALWLFVLPEVGQVGAALIAAAALLLLCFSLLAIVQGIFRRRTTPPRAAAVPRAAVPALLIAEASRLFQENKGAALLAALLAGVNAGSLARK
jgi:hypothetical protein